MNENMPFYGMFFYFIRKYSIIMNHTDSKGVKLYKKTVWQAEPCEPPPVETQVSVFNTTVIKNTLYLTYQC